MMTLRVGLYYPHFTDGAVRLRETEHLVQGHQARRGSRAQIQTLFTSSHAPAPGSQESQTHHIHVCHLAHTTGHIKCRFLLSLQKSEAPATLASHACGGRVGWDRGAAVPFPGALCSQSAGPECRAMRSWHPLNGSKHQPRLGFLPRGRGVRVGSGTP